MTFDEASKIAAAVLYPAAIFYTVHKITPLLSKIVDKFQNIKIGNTTLSIGKEIEKAEEKLENSKEGVVLESKNEDSYLIDEITSRRIESDPRGVIDDAWQNLQENIVKLLKIHNINPDKRRLHESIGILQDRKIITSDFAETLIIARSTFRSAMAVLELSQKSDDIREYVRLTKRASDAIANLITNKKTK